MSIWKLIIVIMPSITCTFKWLGWWVFSSFLFYLLPHFGLVMILVSVIKSESQNIQLSKRTESQWTAICKALHNNQLHDCHLDMLCRCSKLKHYVTYDLLNITTYILHIRNKHRLISECTGSNYRICPCFYVCTYTDISINVYYVSFQYNILLIL